MICTTHVSKRISNKKCLRRDDTLIAKMRENETFVQFLHNHLKNITGRPYTVLGS